MSWVGTVFREVLGLFVDDGGFALAILAWVAAVGLLLPHLGLPAPWNTVILFAGLAGLLIESALRRARRSRDAS